MRLGYRVLKVPTLLGLLAERDELFTRGNAEDSVVFVLSTILQLDCAREPNRSENDQPNQWIATRGTEPISKPVGQRRISMGEGAAL